MPRLSKIGAAALAAFGWTAGGATAVTASYLVVAGGGGRAEQGRPVLHPHGGQLGRRRLPGRAGPGVQGQRTA